MVAGLGALPFPGLGGFTGFGSAAGHHTAGGLALLLAVGLLATAAQLLMTRAYAKGRPLVNASLQYLGIAYSFGFGVLLFDDPVTPMALSGMVLVVAAGLAATQLRSRVVPKDPASSTIQTTET
jgi:S-adenosylmethionine uptake transporter